MMEEIGDMKTGIELIAERQSKVLESDGRLMEIGILLLRAEMMAEFSTINPQSDEAIELLAEAGARIAAEIDRLNELKQ